MPRTEPFELFTDRLNTLGLRYAITGSLASMVYGEPRFTQDVDIILDLPPASINPLCDLFPLEEFYCPPPEVIRVEASRRQRGHFNLIHHDTAFKADIYLRAREGLDEWALTHAQKLEMDDHWVLVAPPEYVILGKLEFYREGGSEKHLRDIRGMLNISSAVIDRAWLENKITELGLESQWQAARGGMNWT